MDGYLDVSKDGFAGRIEVIEGRTGRRRWIPEEKARIAAASFTPGARVADVARQHGTTRWQVYDWRRRLRSGELAVAGGVLVPEFAPFVVEAPAPPERSLRGKRAPKPDPIEVVVGGIVIRADAKVDEAHLTRVVRAVRAAAP